MLGATQPFISGAISKTINMPESSTVEDIADAYLEGWKLGLKAVAIYRDGCKRSQPLSTRREDAQDSRDAAPVVAALAPAPQPGVRRVKLPDERRAITHKFSVNGHEGYITVGLYDNGQPGEIFLTMAKQGSTVSGLVDAFATGISIALQYGVPLKTLVDKFSHTRFEPSGFTTNKEIPIAKSITDYIFRWLASKFLSTDEQRQVGVILRDLPPEAEMHPVSVPAAPRPVAVAAPGAGEDRKITFLNSQDAPSCHACGSIMVRNGSCYKCLDCGETSGCS
jgi:ribonucleoside-diphosphate reductase alpha chain